MPCVNRKHDIINFGTAWTTYIIWTFPHFDKSYDDHVLVLPLSRSCTKRKLWSLIHKFFRQAQVHFHASFSENVKENFISCFKDWSNLFPKVIENFATFNFISRIFIISLHWLTSALYKKSYHLQTKMGNFGACPSNAKFQKSLLSFCSVQEGG